MVDAHEFCLPRENNFPNEDLYFLQEYITSMYVKRQKIRGAKKTRYQREFLIPVLFRIIYGIARENKVLFILNVSLGLPRE
jgi:hypothetical protein